MPISKTEVQHEVHKELDVKRKRSGLPALTINAPVEGEQYAKVFYKHSNQVYGSKMPAKLEGPKNGLSNRFTAGIGQAGMWRNHSLNTGVDHPRFVDGGEEWMQKLQG